MHVAEGHAVLIIRKNIADMQQEFALGDSRALKYLSRHGYDPRKAGRRGYEPPTESRARLADILVESLDAEELGHIDRLWLREAKRRRDEIRSGRVQTVPGDEALRQVRDIAGR
jgi:hypothetical protein